MYDVIFLTGFYRGKDAPNVNDMPALGAYKCAHVLRENGFSCLVIDYVCYLSFEDLVELLENSIGPNTLFVGSSISFLNPTLQERAVLKTSDYVNEFLPYNREFSKKLVNYLKGKSLKLVVGGASVTVNWANKEIDYAVVGYAETAIVNLANSIKDGRHLPKSYRNIYGVTIVDDRTAPEYDFSNSTMSWLDIDVVNRKKLPVEIGRGCIFKCAFCAYPMNGKKKLDFIKNVDNIVDEFKFNYDNYGITNYSIVDDTFNDSVEKITALHEKIIRLPFKLTLWAYLRLDLLTVKPETIDMLYEIGIRSCLLGIETLNLETGKALGKGFDRNRQIETIRKIKEKYPDWKLEGSFIVGAPYESVDSIWNTAKSIANKSLLLDSWDFLPLKIYKNKTTFSSTLDNDYEKFGYSILEDRDWPTIVWQNEHMNFYQAIDLTKEVIEYIHARRPMLTGSTLNTIRRVENINKFSNREKFLSEYKTRLQFLITKTRW